MLSGARLQPRWWSALAPRAAGSPGLGTVGLGVFLAGSLLSAGWLAPSGPPRWRPMVVVAVGGLAWWVIGSPYLGADSIGRSLTGWWQVAAAISTGGWLTVAGWSGRPWPGWRTIGFAVVDLRRPVEERVRWAGS